jgi:hypothetical protein
VPLERAMRILKLTEGLRVTEAGNILYADTEFNEKRAAATGQRVTRLLALFLREVSER